MTSTSINIGMGDKTSSRVLRPPGGGHTDIFGGEPEPPRTGRRMAPNLADPAAAATAAATAAADEAAKPVVSQNPVAPACEESAQATAASQPAQQKAAAAPPQQPNPAAPARVRVPPGGFSSGLW